MAFQIRDDRNVHWVLTKRRLKPKNAKKYNTGLFVFQSLLHPSVNCSSAQQQKQTDKVNKHLGNTTCPDHPLKSPNSACTVPLQQKRRSFKIQLNFYKRQRSKTATRSHLWVLPKRRAHWARRGHSHRTCWRSALESSSASPWPGRTLGTVESSPACPDWPAPSCSSLPVTDSGTAEIISKRRHPTALKGIFIIQHLLNMHSFSICTRVRDCRACQTPVP